MICIVAMIIAGILGIFSASYREIAKDAFNCVFKNLTLRKCDSGADQRLKTAITSKKKMVFCFTHCDFISRILACVKRSTFYRSASCFLHA